MNQLKNILVGVDFSEGASAALHQALRIAAQNRATLHVVHVIDAAALNELAAAFSEPGVQQRSTALALGREELVRWLQPFDLPETCRTEVTVGDPLETLLVRARELGSDLIVVGAQGDDTESPYAGPLAVRVLRRAPGKVLLVDRAHDRPFQTIVACVDFADSAREVVEQAKRLAALGAKRVDFLHVFEPPWERLRRVLPAQPPPEAAVEQYLGTLRRQLKDFAGDVPDVETRHELHESPRHRSGIAAYARTQDADLIVLATSGRPGEEAGGLASTAERLIRELPCSVLALKPVAGSGASV